MRTIHPMEMKASLVTFNEHCHHYPERRNLFLETDSLVIMILKYVTMPDKCRAFNAGDITFGYPVGYIPKNERTEWHVWSYRLKKLIRVPFSIIDHNHERIVDINDQIFRQFPEL